MGLVGRRLWQAALPLFFSVTACAGQPSAVQPVRSETPPARVTQIPLPGSGYVHDVAIAAGAVWVTSSAGLYRIDLATTEAVNVLPNDYLFRVATGHGAIWITTGSDGHVLRVDPVTRSVTAVIEVRAGPVTELAMSENALWASAASDLVRIDPVTNEVVARLRSQGSFGDVAIGESGLWVIAGANRDGEVWQIDPTTNAVRRRVRLANPSFWNEIAVGDGAVWVTSSPTAHRDGIALVHLHRIDPLTGGITEEIPLGNGPTGLGPQEGAASYSALALGEDSVWTIVSFEGLLLEVDAQSLGVSQALDGIQCCSSGGPPGMTVGAGSVWITAPDGITRINLQT